MEYEQRKFLKQSEQILQNEETITFVCAFGPIATVIGELKRYAIRQPAVTLKTACDGLSLDFAQILGNKNFSDIILECDGKSFQAHKIILSARSVVFNAMFSNDMLENKDGRVKITDINSTTFSHFLKYIYTGKLPVLTAEIVIGLYKAGDKYAVEHLKSECIDYMVGNLTPENALTFLVPADLHGDSKFKSAILLFIKTQAKEIRKWDSFQKFRKEFPMLALDIYDACND